MARARGGRIAAGLLLASLGAALVWIGLDQPSWVGSALATYPTRNVVVGGGVGLVGGAMLVIILSFTRQRHEPSIVPAEIAFARPATPRPLIHEHAHPTAAAPSAIRAGPVPAVAATGATLAAPEPVSLSPEEVALKRISAEIRELTRAINKAGVMLATGQISAQGYQQYVEDLKHQRGVLERDRVQLEMRNHKLN